MVTMGEANMAYPPPPPPMFGGQHYSIGNTPEKGFAGGGVNVIVFENPPTFFVVKASIYYRHAL